ncbi:MAG TPA: hypothetical protein VFE22_04570 [Edaphobacter sp.]|nr:hypothetical protein [Edaphobacter sp.]
MEMPKRQRFELRLPADQMARMKQAAKARGFRSVNAYLGTVLAEDLRGRESPETDREARLAASIDRLSREIRTVHTAQQAVFAAIDSLARLFLTCVPEPPPEALDQARRRARVRYDRFLLSVAQNMTAGSKATLTELLDRG